MFNKTLRNKIKLCIGMMLCAVAVLATPITTIVTYASESGDIETCADFREWLYKIEDGKLYKRLYNRSTGLWETDWIFVCNYPPTE